MSFRRATKLSFAAVKTSRRFCRITKTKMIGYLHGKLVDKRTNQVLVDVNGVGYLVSIPLSTFYALGELHDEVTLLVHTHLREDPIALYGFLAARVERFFE